MLGMIFKLLSEYFVLKKVSVPAYLSIGLTFLFGIATIFSLQDQTVQGRKRAKLPPSLARTFHLWAD